MLCCLNSRVHPRLSPATASLQATMLHSVQAFRNGRGPRYMPHGGITSGMTGGMLGARGPVDGNSDAMYTSYGNHPHNSPFGESFGQEPYQESTALGNSAAQSGAEVTLNLNQKSAL